MDSFAQEQRRSFKRSALALPRVWWSWSDLRVWDWHRALHAPSAPQLRTETPAGLPVSAGGEGSPCQPPAVGPGSSPKSQPDSGVSASEITTFYCEITVTRGNSNMSVNLEENKFTKIPTRNQGLQRWFISL